MPGLVTIVSASSVAKTSVGLIAKKRRVSNIVFDKYFCLEN
jgi:hypothetical protein